MNLATTLLYAYGTSEGVKKEWDTRSRGIGKTLYHGERDGGGFHFGNEGGYWTSDNKEHAASFGSNVAEHPTSSFRITPGVSDVLNELNYHRRTDDKLDDFGDATNKDWQKVAKYWKAKGYQGINFGHQHRDDANDIWLFDRPK